MCRFVAYVGSPIVLDELLLKPENGLINQSFDAEEMAQPLNGDGFGLGWYAKNIRPEPAVFRSIIPAWNNQNLIYNASVIQSDCVFAHVRAATEGGITEYNCHPFHYKQFLMMHNGGIGNFQSIRRQFLARLTNEAFHWIDGQTDSEHIFALLVQNLSSIRNEKGALLAAADVARGFRRTFETIDELRHEAGTGSSFCTYNMMITDGTRLFGTRYASGPGETTPTLYYSAGTRFADEGSGSAMIHDEESDEKAVIIASEKLNDRYEEWHAIPQDNFVAVNEKLEIMIEPL